VHGENSMMRLVGHVAGMVNISYVLTLVREPERKRPIETPRRGW